MRRDQQRRAGLLLSNSDHVAGDVLPAHANGLATTLRGVEQQRERETCARVDGMPRA